MEVQDRSSMVYLYITESPRNQVLERKTGISARGDTSEIGVFSGLDFGMRFCEVWRLILSGLGVVLERKSETKCVCVGRRLFTCFRYCFLEDFRSVYDRRMNTDPKASATIPDTCLQRARSAKLL